MKKSLVTLAAFSIVLLGACSNGESTEEKTAGAVASETDTAVCEAIATRTDELYEYRDAIDGAEDAEQAETGHWIGLERLNRELRRGAAEVTDEKLLEILTPIREDDLSYDLVSHAAGEKDIERVYVAMNDAKVRCGELGAPVAEADTTAYPTY